jgi:hypothetical protein
LRKEAKGGTEEGSENERVQPDSDFLRKDLNNLLIRTPSDHIAMPSQHPNDLPACRRRFQVKIVVPIRRTVISRALSSGDEMFNGGHEDVDGSVETFGDCIVERGLELLLFANDGVEEVLLVDVGGLSSSTRSEYLQQVETMKKSERTISFSK